MPQQPNATRAGKTILCIPCPPDVKAGFLTLRAAEPVAGTLDRVLFSDEAVVCGDGLRAPLFFRCLVFGMASTRSLYD
ncbi:MAG TPA: hypothetical protein VKV40_00225 [Ktedonobacteraceae bacterium]|nr:hypothetical protein [Ktedonobacteraceae bacterium]